MKRLEWFWCQDEVCDCTAPQIVEITDIPVPEQHWNGPKQRAALLEDGPWISPTSCATPEELAEQKQWAKDACARHGIPYSDPP